MRDNGFRAPGPGMTKTERVGATTMEWLRKVVLDPRTERFIMAVIIANAVVLGLETSKPIMASYGRVLELLDHIMLGIFVVELTARIIVHRLAFFRDPWSVFDFIVVAIALVPTT